MCVCDVHFHFNALNLSVQSVQAAVSREEGGMGRRREPHPDVFEGTGRHGSDQACRKNSQCQYRRRTTQDCKWALDRFCTADRMCKTHYVSVERGRLLKLLKKQKCLCLITEPTRKSMQPTQGGRRQAPSRGVLSVYTTALLNSRSVRRRWFVSYNSSSDCKAADHWFGKNEQLSRTPPPKILERLETTSARDYVK